MEADEFISASFCAQGRVDKMVLLQTLGLRYGVVRLYSDGTNWFTF